MRFGMLIETTNNHFPGVSFQPNSYVDDLMLLWNLVDFVVTN